jgi:MFS family permease
MNSINRPTEGFANSGAGLALLTACYIMAQAVTQIVGLLVVPLQASLHTTDTQMGLLQGFAFIFVYVLAGIPIARFIDRGDRLRMIAVCVLLFSVATILSGLARSFAVLVLMRAGTGIAEAAVPPAAFSIFSEAGGARRVAQATGTFMLAPFVGAGVAIAGGGLIIRLLPIRPH